MKQEIQREDQQKVKQLSKVFTGLFLLMVVTPVPLFKTLQILGVVIWIVLAIFTIYMAILVEEQKKKYDIQSYREIVAFCDGTSLDELNKAKEALKAPYQKVLLACGSAVLTFAVCFIFFKWMNL